MMIAFSYILCTVDTDLCCFRVDVSGVCRLTSSAAVFQWGCPQAGWNKRPEVWAGILLVGTRSSGWEYLRCVHFGL